MAAVWTVSLTYSIQAILLLWVDTSEGAKLAGDCETRKKSFGRLLVDGQAYLESKEEQD